jgi:CBS domain-containing protein
MFVSRSMTRKVITVHEDADLHQAREKMASNKIRHLPVIDGDNRLKGIVTDRDIRSAMPSAALNEKEDGSAPGKRHHDRGSDYDSSHIYASGCSVDDSENKGGGISRG